MHIMLLGLAASAAAFPGTAGLPEVSDWSASQFAASGSTGVRIHRGGRDGFTGEFRRDRDRRDRNDRRRHRDFDGEVYYLDREYQGDTAWRAESYNDWWHERPNRSFPRWTTNNGRCERMWWGGEGWRC